MRVKPEHILIAGIVLLLVKRRQNQIQGIVGLGPVVTKLLVERGSKLATHELHEAQDVLREEGAAAAAKSLALDAAEIAINPRKASSSIREERREGRRDSREGAVDPTRTAVDALSDVFF